MMPLIDKIRILITKHATNLRYIVSYDFFGIQSFNSFIIKVKWPFYFKNNRENSIDQNSQEIKNTEWGKI